MSDKSLFERLGGADTVDSMVTEFYDRVLAVPELEPFFKNANLDKLLAMQREFFTAALDGPLPYTGLPLNYAHQDRGIERKHFALFVNHLLETLKDRGVQEDEVGDVIARVNTYITDITGSLGSAG